VLANAFAKYYYIGETRGFEKWKQAVEFDKRRERLMNKMIMHWRQHMFNRVKAAFKTYIISEDIRERESEVKHKELEVEET
jgi:hypothetical protein